jgi:hypothetical protein
MTAKTNRRGVARIRVADRHPYPVHVKARGFGVRTVRESFRRRRKSRSGSTGPSSSGRSTARGSAQPSPGHIRLRPPFRVVRSRGIGPLIEFPAVVSDGVAYIGNFRGTVRAIRCASVTSS